MIWLSWRQQRMETRLVVAALALFVWFLIPAGIHLAAAYAQEAHATCHKGPTACANADGVRWHAILHNKATLDFFVTPFNVLSGLIGIVLAVPVVRELDNGTAAFAWTQGITRARWLTSKLGFAALTAVLAGTTAALLVGWARGPINSEFGRFADGAFDLQGTVPVAYLLFALALSLYFGVLLRRTGPALVIAGLTFAATRIFVDKWLRHRLLTPVTANWPPTQNGPKATAWYLSSGPSNRAGILSHASRRMIDNCLAPRLHPINETHCLAKLGAAYNHAVYFPDSRFWDFQAVETTLFVGVALLLIAFASWRVLRAE